MSTAAAIDLALTAIIEGLPAVRLLLDQLRDKGEITDAQYQALGERAEAAFKAPHWQPDAK